MEEEEAQPGRKSWRAGWKKGRREKKEEVCDIGPVEDKTQCSLRGEKKHFLVAIGNAVSLQTGLQKEQD